MAYVILWSGFLKISHCGHTLRSIGFYIIISNEDHIPLFCMLWFICKVPTEEIGHFPFPDIQNYPSWTCVYFLASVWLFPWVKKQPAFSKENRGLVETAGYLDSNSRLGFIHSSHYSLILCISKIGELGMKSPKPSSALNV